MNIPIYKRGVVISHASVDSKDYDEVAKHKWRLHPRGYAVTTVGTILMHRLIMKPIDGLYVDHINHDKLDNKRSNLRCVTQKVNMANRRINENNKTGAKGVQFFRDKYRVYVGRAYVGVFTDIDEASSAYDVAYKKYFSVKNRMDEEALRNG